MSLVEEICVHISKIIRGSKRQYIMRIIGLDYGSKTVGVAVSDALGG